MSSHHDQPDPFTPLAGQPLLDRLDPASQRFVQSQARRYRFTLQELRQVCDIAVDLQMWGVGPIDSHWPPDPGRSDRPARKRLMHLLRERWEQLRQQPNRYQEQAVAIPLKSVALARDKPQLGLGQCPVASPRTRCCNLLTLDAVDNCGYACSYCSIQSFYEPRQVHFDPGFNDKLERLSLDPDCTYHIGTGQSSDSLMWGNASGTLDALIAFARRHPNVILELKSKSANVAHLLSRNLPANLLCSWSLNPPPIVAHEERGSASLEQRLDAAEALARHGCLVGFHLHPMIHFAGWRAAYGDLLAQLPVRFDPAQVAMVSLGTLTYTRKVLRQIRARGGPSQILKMPLVEAAGKLSYPEEIKMELFRFAYQALRPWHDRVFFYLCMEHPDLWQKVLGHGYSSNQQFETAMKEHYTAKIARLRARQAS